jgi:transcriptional regulator
MARTDKISLTQKAEIIRLRKDGMEFKRIAQKLKCTPEQAARCWHTSEAKRQTSNIEIWQAKRHAAIAQKQASLAATALQQEIAEAVAEATQAPLYKPGNLEW